MIETFISGNVGSIKLTEKENKTGETFSVLTFSVASHSKNPEGKEITNWVTCKMWGSRGVALSKHLVSGQSVSVLGRPEAKLYTSEDGTPKSDLVVHIDKFEFSGAKPKSLSGTGKEPFEL